MSASTLPAPTHCRVLFVGSDGSSPQIAASLLRSITGELVAVETAGPRPSEGSGRSDELLVAMGLDPASEQRLSARALHTADRVVILDPGLDVARLPGPTYEEWDLGQDDLVARVQSLSDELSNPRVAERRPALLHRLGTGLGTWLRPLRRS